MNHIYGLKIYSAFTLIFCLSIFSVAAQDNEAEMVYQQTNIHIENGKKTEEHSFEIRINKRGGDKYAGISIAYQKGNKIYDLEAALFDKNGTEIRKLRKSDIIEKSAYSDISFYTDSYVKEFSMRHNEYPYTLKYSYKSQSGQFLFIAYWNPVLDFDIPTTKATLHVTTPKNFRLNFHTSNVVNSTIDTTLDQKVYTWETSYNGAVKTESFSPPEPKFMPEVIVVPEQFLYEEEGFTRNWVDIGNWDQKLIEDLSELPEAEKTRIKETVKNIADTVEQIRSLFHYLQENTRYISVSVKTGGHKPYPASYVAINKYGDCKALANYFLACLKEIHVQAFYTLINAGDVITETETKFPSQQFNHVILFVPLANDTLWLDCTSDLAFGYLGTATQNRLALVTKSNDSRFYTTPALTMDEVLERRVIRASLNAESTVITDVNCTFHGQKYEFFSYLNTNFNETEKQNYLSRHFIWNGYQFDKFNINLPGRDSVFINYHFEASSDQQVKTYGNESLLKVPEMEVPPVELPKVRTLPVQINYPINRVDSLTYTFPDGYNLRPCPADWEVITKYGEYKTEFRSENGKICVNKMLKIYAGRYPLEEYSQFFGFVNQVRENEKSTYITLTTK